MQQAEMPTLTNPTPLSLLPSPRLSLTPALYPPARRARLRLVTCALVLAFALALIAPVVSPPRRAAAAPAANPVTLPSAILNFPATGHAVRTAAFVSYFEANGGVQTFGYPLADETWENGRLVQYFERQRFEYHPEFAGTAYAVELGRLGDEYSRTEQPFATVAPFASGATRTYVAATHHSVAEPFLSYWQSHGGVSILGYPISEPITERGQQVQYFERARFEYHPENAGTSYAVLLTLLGKLSYEQHHGVAVSASAPAAPAPAPAAPAAAPAPTLLNAMEDRLLQQINNARAQGGLQRVTLDPQVIALARDRSADMANRSYFDHHTPDGHTFLDMLRTRNIPFAMAGEIIAQNNYPVAQTVDQAFQGYWGSAEHHQIIMMGNWRTVGVGEAVDGQGMYYYTVIFVQAN